MWCADAAAHSHCSDGPPSPGATPCAAALWSISRTVVGGGCDAAALRFSSAVRSSRPVSFGVRSSNVSTSVSPFVSTSISSWDGSMFRTAERGKAETASRRRDNRVRPPAGAALHAIRGLSAAHSRVSLHAVASFHAHLHTEFFDRRPACATCTADRVASHEDVKIPLEGGRGISLAARCRTGSRCRTAHSAPIQPRRAAPRRDRVQRRGGARRLRVLDLPRRIRAVHAAEAVRAHAAEGVRPLAPHGLPQAVVRHPAERGPLPELPALQNARRTSRRCRHRPCDRDPGRRQSDRAVQLVP